MSRSGCCRHMSHSLQQSIVIQSKYVDLCFVHLISLWASLCAVTAPEKGVTGSGRYHHVSRSFPQYLMSLMNAWYFAVLDIRNFHTLPLFHLLPSLFPPVNRHLVCTHAFFMTCIHVFARTVWLSIDLNWKRDDGCTRASHK